MKLIIAEKPSVAKGIAPVVGANEKKDGYTEGNGYIVSWCFGHLVGLKYPNDYNDKWAGKWSFDQLPMIPDEWEFTLNKDCENQYNVLKKLLNDKNIDEVICATDADREGECIFRYVYNLSGSNKPVKRLWISSLEESAIKDGLEKMKNGSEYDNLFAAGFCRARADWLVGMNGSRLFSCRYNSPLNLGRVQTPTLAMIVNRDKDVKNFVKQKFFTVELDCGSFTASSDRIDAEENADKIVAEINGKTATVSEVKKEVKTVNPPKLFDLTTLQREANRQFGYSAQQTLDFLQALYEAKLATYPRTDSQFLSDDMEQTAENVVSKVCKVFPAFGSSPEVDVKRVINNKKVSGHHAIIPTVNIENADLESLDSGQKDILKLISANLIMATAQPHKYEAVKITINCENTVFFANGKTVITNGWKSIEAAVKADLKNKNSDDDFDDEKNLPDLNQGQTFENVSGKKAEHYTSPPKPYTEDTLLSAMEHAGSEDCDDEDIKKKGLGTPATRAATIEGLLKHGYVQRNKKQIIATDKGVHLIDVVPEEVKSPKLTAEWEMQLKQVECGEYSADEFMDGITGYVKSICDKYGSKDTSISFSSSSSAAIGKCPKCGNDVKKGKFGYYCTGKCGMNIAKVFGKELNESQIKKLLDGKEISYTSNGKKTTVLPEIIQNDYNGKTYFNWKTKVYKTDSKK